VGGKGQDVAYTLHCLQYNHVPPDVSSSSSSSSSPPFHLSQFIGTGYEGDTVIYTMARDFDDPNTFQPTTAITTEEVQELLRMVAESSMASLASNNKKSRMNSNRRRRYVSWGV
jgi:hypothetical protein